MFIRNRRFRKNKIGNNARSISNWDKKYMDDNKHTELYFLSGTLYRVIVPPKNKYEDETTDICVKL